jgi:hypothetical protein
MDEGDIRDSEWSKFFEDETPWDENKWEVFMRDEDERTCRFFGKFTKSKDLPDCEEMIVRELNGDYGEDEEIECPHSGTDCNECPDRDECDPFSDDDTEDDDDIVLPADFRDDPLWKQAYEVAVRLQHLAKSKMEDAAGRGPLFDLLLNTRMIQAKIAGAFGIGFHIEALGGNIAGHKRAFLSALKSLDALAALEPMGILSPKQCARHRKALLDLRERLMCRISELRQLFQKLCEES